MKKLWILLTIFVFCLVFSIECAAYDIEYSAFDGRELRAKLMELLPEDWNTGFLQAGYLEGRDSHEYVVWHIARANQTASFDDNQVLVFSYIQGVLSLIWKSDIFEGEVVEFYLANLDNSGADNISLILDHEINGKRVRYLRSYDWNREFTQLRYPQDNFIELSGDLILVDYIDQDDDIEILVHSPIPNEPNKYKIEWYCFKNGSLELEWEETKLLSVPQPIVTALPPIEEEDKPFDEFLKTNNLGFLLKAYNLHHDNLYLLDVGTAEGNNYNKYMLVKKEYGVVKIQYELDEMYNDTYITPEDIQDMNIDGYIEVVFRDSATVVTGYLVYIVSLTPRIPQLISPVTPYQLENGRYMSEMFLHQLRGPLDLRDLNDDGTPELGTSTYFQNELVTQFWSWDAKRRIYTPVKIEVWDETTKSFIVIDQPADI